MLEDWLSVVHESWEPFIDSQKYELQEIYRRVAESSRVESVLPKPTQVMRCLSMPIEEVRVVIIGQDPYPNSDDACGLAFASKNLRVPKSLENIRIELQDDLGCKKTDFFDLSAWHLQGVMLLNRVLTINEGETNSHANLGWEDFTLALVRHLDKQQKFVAILWGNSAISIEKYLSNAKVVKSPHPSPLSAYRGFFGSKPFSNTNQALIHLGNEPIDWCLAFTNA